MDGYNGFHKGRPKLRKHTITRIIDAHVTYLQSTFLTKVRAVTLMTIMSI
jgi:hypothetical protein